MMDSFMKVAHNLIVASNVVKKYYKKDLNYHFAIYDSGYLWMKNIPNDVDKVKNNLVMNHDCNFFYQITEDLRETRTKHYHLKDEEEYYNISKINHISQLPSFVTDFSMSDSNIAHSMRVSLNTALLKHYQNEQERIEKKINTFNSAINEYNNKIKEIEKESNNCLPKLDKIKDKEHTISLRLENNKAISEKKLKGLAWLEENRNELKNI